MKKVFSFFAGFFKAGVDHTIMSLWSVNDKATKELMILFFRDMLAKQRSFYPASHLREAILQFKTKQSNPALWAPFIYLASLIEPILCPVNFLPFVQ